MVGNEIWVIGGFDGVSTLNTIEVYDTEYDAWNAEEEFPVTIAWTSSGVINGKIYVAGGFYGSGNTWHTRNITYEYDPNHGDWVQKKEIPKNSGGNGSCVFNDKLYLFGGDGENTDTLHHKGVLVYDPASDTWDSIPDMKYRRQNGPVACVYEDKLYVMGGENESGSGWSSISTPEKFDPSMNAWTELAEMPAASIYPVVLVHNERIYVFGGSQTHNSNAMRIVQEYDPATDTWILMENMPFRLSEMKAEKVNNHLYFFGGTSDFIGGNDKVWRFNLDSLREGCKEVTIRDFELPEVGDSVWLYADVVPVDFWNQSMVWSTDDESVATISENGYLKMISEGTFNVTAKLKYGSCYGTWPPNVISEELNPSSISIYPNPVNDLLNIKIGIPSSYIIKITSLNGKLLLYKQIDGSESKLDISSFNSGVYLVSVTSNDLTTTKKLMKW